MGKERVRKREGKKKRGLGIGKRDGRVKEIVLPGLFINYWTSYISFSDKQTEGQTHTLVA